MLKAYSVFKDLDKKACEIIRSAGIQLDLSNSDQRPNKEELLRLFNDYDILIIGVKEKITEDMLVGIHKNKIIATLSIGLDHIDNTFFNTDLVEVINCPTSNVISVAEHIFSLILSLKKRIIEANNISINGGSKKDLSKSKNLISKDKIRLMKKSATFINTSRAEIVDINELMKYSDENDTFNVGLDIDVEDYKEILKTKRNNVIVTPHIAGVTQEAIKRIDVELANNIKKSLNM